VVISIDLLIHHHVAVESVYVLLLIKWDVEFLFYVNLMLQLKVILVYFSIVIGCLFHRN